MISLIVAHSKNHVIGNKGDIPWSLPEDLKRFKELTTGHTIIMGRKTFESIGRPLPNRVNVVITRNPDFKYEGVKVARSLDEALELAKNDGEVFVIGGGEIYKQALPKANKVYATILDTEIPGDTFFPRLNLEEWGVVKREKNHGKGSGVDYDYVDYERRESSPELYYIDAGRTLDQIEQMEDLEKRGVCVFCEEHFAREHREPVEIETAHWLVAKNDYPYKHTKLHLLFVPKEHVSTVTQLSKNARNDLSEVLAMIESKYKLESYSQIMRVGDFRYTGASIYHLHGHIIVADHTSPDFQSIKVKLGSKPSS